MNKEIVKWRRDFHKYAETGWLEMRTASLIARYLTEMGYSPKLGKELCGETRMGLPAEDELETHYLWAQENGADSEYLPMTRGGYTAVMAELDCGDGPLTVVRFDMDALGVKESDDPAHKPVSEGFASVSDGIMHACAHDGHMAIGLGVAKKLIGMKKTLTGKIRIVFQPAEEGVRGAKSVVESGIVDDADYVIAAHIVPDGGTEAQVAFIEDGGQIGLATSKLDVVFRGKASHAGANPEQGNNAMLAAATAVLNIHAIPRYAKVPTQVNVGKLTAGTGRNVVCDFARLEMETRGESSEANKFVEDYAINIAKNAASMHGCNVSIERVGGTPALFTSADITKRAISVCEAEGYRVLAGKNLGRGSEDFAYFSEKVISQGGQALYFALPTPAVSANHSEVFDYDESVLERGVNIMVAIVKDLNGV